MVSDDASTDRTRALLAAWQLRWTLGTLTVVDGPARGFAENFRHLVRRAPPGYDYYGFCDQDDVWRVDKLARAIVWHEAQPAGHPALHCGRTRLIDAADRPIGHSPLFTAPPGFRNALVQSLAGGNTMLLNAEAFALLAESMRRTPILMHDWWSYLIVSGAGGIVHYDRTPALDYRQHGGNAIGAGIGGRPARFLALLRGRYVDWSDANLAALDKCRDLLTPDAGAAIDTFAALRRTTGPQALQHLRRAGLYRQTRKGDLALTLAALLGKL